MARKILDKRRGESAKAELAPVFTHKRTLRVAIGFCFAFVFSCLLFVSSSPRDFDVRLLPFPPV